MFRKKAVLFFIIVIILFSFMTYQSRKGYSLMDNPASFLLNGASSAISAVLETLKRPFQMIAVRDEDNRALQKKVDELMLERMRYQEALLENKRLKDLLKLKEDHKDTIASARIIGRGTSHWTHTFILDKGMQDGITKDSTAITPKGLAGKIFNVSDSFSSVLLLTDINFAAAVRLQESRKEAILSGTGTGKTILKYLPPEHEVKEGEIVVTSGLDLLFPPGIPAGYVSKVNRQGAGQFQYIEVIPFVDNASIEEVLIIK
ncbi:MAG: rod shape-determining protein MreC [Nitrospirae bacterium]|nr:rod shape-determining protein MreC [Nitrospirota bacterium]